MILVKFSPSNAGVKRIALGVVVLLVLSLSCAASEHHHNHQHPHQKHHDDTNSKSSSDHTTNEKSNHHHHEHHHNHQHPKKSHHSSNHTASSDNNNNENEKTSNQNALGQTRIHPTIERNVFGGELEPCSTPGMALTGLNQDGRCATKNEFDERFQPICINVRSFPTFAKEEEEEEGHRRTTSLWSILFGSSSKNEEEEEAEETEPPTPQPTETEPPNPRDNFFTLSGQPDLLLEQEMPCAENPDDKSYPISHWCVGIDEFAYFLDHIGGLCERMGPIYCEETNLQALKAYEDLLVKKNTLEKEKAHSALACLKNRCWIA